MIEYEREMYSHREGADSDRESETVRVNGTNERRLLVST